MKISRAQLSAFVQSMPIPMLLKAGLMMAIPQLPEETFLTTIPAALGIGRALLEGDGERAVAIFSEHVSEADRRKALDLIKAIK